MSSGQNFMFNSQKSPKEFEKNRDIVKAALGTGQMEITVSQLE